MPSSRDNVNVPDDNRSEVMPAVRDELSVWWIWIVALVTPNITLLVLIQGTSNMPVTMLGIVAIVFIGCPMSLVGARQLMYARREGYSFATPEGRGRLYWSGLGIQLAVILFIVLFGAALPGPVAQTKPPRSPFYSQLQTTTSSALSLTLSQPPLGTTSDPPLITSQREDGRSAVPEPDPTTTRSAPPEPESSTTRSAPPSEERPSTTTTPEPDVFDDGPTGESSSPPITTPPSVSPSDESEEFGPDADNDVWQDPQDTDGLESSPPFR